MSSKQAAVGIALVAALAGFSYFYLSSEEAPKPQETADSASITQITMIKATISTARGALELELYPEAAPKTVENFIKLSESGFYNGTKFHRVVPGFVIQGGDPLSKTDDPRVGTGGPGYQFADEINPRTLGLDDGAIQALQAQGYVYNFELTSLPMDVGVLAMANAGPNTNGSQFFIVTTGSQPHLNGRHTVFGKVVSGMDVVRAIQQGDAILSITIAQN